MVIENGCHIYGPKRFNAKLLPICLRGVVRHLHVIKSSGNANRGRRFDATTRVALTSWVCWTISNPTRTSRLFIYPV